MLITRQFSIKKEEGEGEGEEEEEGEEVSGELRYVFLSSPPPKKMNLVGAASVNYYGGQYNTGMTDKFCSCLSNHIIMHVKMSISTTSKWLISAMIILCVLIDQVLLFFTLCGLISLLAIIII